MSHLKKRHYAYTLLFSIGANLLMLCFLILANRSEEEDKQDTADDKRPIIIEEIKPPKPIKRFVNKLRENRMPTRAQTTIPNLPSRFSSPEFALSDNPSDGLFGEIGGFVEEMPTSFIFKEEAVDTPPKIIHSVLPKYPWSAEKRGDEGYVVFKLQLSKDGRIEKIRTIESVPSGIFDEEAKKAIRQYRFSPAMYHGKPVPVVCRQKLVFSLGK